MHTRGPGNTETVFLAGERALKRWETTPTSKGWAKAVKALSAFREQLKEERARAPELIVRSITWAALLRTQGESQQSEAPINEAIALAEVARQKATSARELLRCERHLARAHLARHELLGEERDLETAFHLLSEIWDRSTSTRNADLADLLGVVHLRLFKFRGEFTDLQAAVLMARRAVDWSSLRAWNRHGYVNRLANALLARFEHEALKRDIDEAIAHYKEAIENAPSEVKPVYLNNLANALLIKYRVTANVLDLEQAISHHKTSAKSRLAPGDQARSLLNLASGLAEYGRVTRSATALDDAVTACERARALVTRKSALYFTCTVCLARILTIKARATGESRHLQHALKLWQKAKQSRVSSLFGPGDACFEFALALSLKNTLASRRTAMLLLSECYNELATRRLTGDGAATLGYQNQLAKIVAAIADVFLCHATARDTPVHERREAKSQALLILENSRVSLLCERLGLLETIVPAGMPDDLLARENAAVAAVRAAMRMEHTHQPADLTISSEDARLETVAASAVARFELREVWEEMEALGGAVAKYASGRGSRNITWEQVLQIANAGNGTALATLHIAFDKIFLFIVRSDWRYPQVVSEPIAPADIQAARERFVREVVDDRWDSPEQTWDRLFVRLFKKATRWVKGSSAIALSIPGSLWSFPFALVADHAGWGERLTLPPMIILPTLRIAAQRATLRGWGAPVVVGNATCDRSFAEKEARSVAGKLNVNPLVREEATRARVLAGIEKAQLIHFAGHSRHVRSSPLESGIELADGPLTAGEILSLRLRADLVVVSGCDSAVLASLESEELAGLTQALLQSGARAVIVSLWDVHDRSTRILMERFYDFLDKTGPANALAQAMAYLRSSAGFDPPYYWAPFVAVGALDSLA
jgi:tetratricopeptide (TPR) repeat protein